MLNVTLAIQNSLLKTVRKCKYKKKVSFLECEDIFKKGRFQNGHLMLDKMYCIKKCSAC